MVGAMLPRHPTDLPQTHFDPFGECLEPLREHQLHRFGIRIDQDEVEEEVGEGHPTEGGAEIRHMREVRLRHDAGAMDLGEEDLLGGAVLRAPGGDLALERAELGSLVVLRPALPQQGEERRRLQRRVAGELLLHPRPIVGERIGARAIAAWLLPLAGRFAAPFVGAGGPHAHPRPRGGLFLGHALGAFAKHDPYLPVGFHDALLRGRHAQSRAVAGSLTGNPHRRHRQF
jgi:hypothetical protein